jgi:hypothetical protein
MRSRVAAFLRRILRSVAARRRAASLLPTDFHPLDKRRELAELEEQLEIRSTSPTSAESSHPPRR